MSNKKRNKVYHFVSSFNIGGVEVAIEKSLPELREVLDISIFYVRYRGVIEVGQNPWWYSFKNIFIDRPDIVITSLWSAHIFGIIFWMTGVKWVCFVHNSGVTHLIDNIFCKIAILLSDFVAADSDKTKNFILSIKSSARVHVIPYVFHRPECSYSRLRVRNSFIFVGRNTSQKRLDLVVKFFESVLERLDDSLFRFVISGISPACVDELLMKYPGRVILETNIKNEEVIARLEESEYFVLLSDYEGFCMAAYEAAQAGCHIIYRDVGEVSTYIDKEISFLVKNYDNFFNEFLEWHSRKKIKFNSGQYEEICYSGTLNTYNFQFLELMNIVCPPG